MSINNVEIQDSNGNVYYPHTDSSVVKFGNSDVGTALSEKANQTDLNTTNSNVSTNTTNIAQLSNPNLLINGDFQVWQRGTSFSIASGLYAYTADRFYVANEGVTSGILVTKDSTGALRLTAQSSEDQSSNIRYYPELDEVKRWIGKTLTASIEYYNEYYDNWNDGVDCFCNGSTGSLNVTNISSKKIDLGSGWIRKVVTLKINSIKSDATWFHIQFLRANGNTIFGYHLIRSIKLEYGDIETPFVPRFYAEELSLCQRYYEATVSDFPFDGMYYSSNTPTFFWRYKIIKRVAPTITIGHTIYGQNYVYFSTANYGGQTGAVTSKTIYTDHLRVVLPSTNFGEKGAFTAYGYAIADAEIY